MSPARDPRLLGAVFAGGQSTRMGQPKALMSWPAHAPGTPLFAHAARILEPMVALVEIASGTDAERLRSSLAGCTGSDWGMFPDAIEGAGPLAALVAALHRARAERCDGILALACDMPLVTPAELEPLVAAIALGADAALWVVDGIEQPLCAAYSVTCAPRARGALERGARRLVATFDGPEGPSVAPLCVRRLVPNENSRLRLMNVNTPGDYDSARRLRDDPKGRTAAGPGGADYR